MTKMSDLLKSALEQKKSKATTSKKSAASDTTTQAKSQVASNKVAKRGAARGS